MVLLLFGKRSQNNDKRCISRSITLPDLLKNNRPVIQTLQLLGIPRPRFGFQAVSLICATDSYASLYFATIVDKEENGFLALELLHQYVEILDRYFGNVCELDLIFNFHKAYQILDELMMGGYVHESSKKQTLKMVASQDEALEESKDDDKQH